MKISVEDRPREGGLATILVSGIDASNRTQSLTTNFVIQLIDYRMMHPGFLLKQVDGGLKIQFAETEEQIAYLLEGLKNLGE